MKANKIAEVLAKICGFCCCASYGVSFVYDVDTKQHATFFLLGFGLFILLLVLLLIVIATDE